MSGIDLKKRTLDASCPGLGTRKIAFDFLVVAAGMRPMGVIAASLLVERMQGRALYVLG